MVVIGGGFIAMEVASVLAQKSIDVTMVLNQDRIGKRFFSPQMSTFFESYYAARGVHLVKSAIVTELCGDGSVNSVVLADGQAIACEMVVVGVGVAPSTDMLVNSGIEVGDGVMVSEYLETNQIDVYAAGDVANSTSAAGFQSTLARRPQNWKTRRSRCQLQWRNKDEARLTCFRSKSRG